MIKKKTGIFALLIKKSGLSGFDVASLNVVLFLVFTILIFYHYAAEKLKTDSNATSNRVTNVAEFKFNSDKFEKNAKYSADNRFIAFVRQDKSPYQESIFIYDLDRKISKSLVQLNGEVFDIAWSPDSSKLLFSYRRAGDNCKIDLIVFAEIDTPQKRKHVTSCFDSRPNQLAWNQKGDVIYFNAKSHSDHFYQTYAFSLYTKEPNLLTLNRDSNDQVVGNSILKGRSDGRRLATFSGTISGEQILRIYDTNTDSMILTRKIDKQITNLAWLGTSDELIVVIDEQLYRYDPQRNEFGLAYNEAKNIENISSDSNGKIVVFTRTSAIFELVSYDVLDNSITKLLENSPQNIYKPNRARNSGEIAYFSRYMNKMQIWLKPPDSVATRLSNSPVSLDSIQLEWSPDEQFLLFMHFGELFTIEVKTRKIERVLSSDHKIGIAIWSKDGKTIFYSSKKSGKWQVWAYMFRSGINQVIIQSGGFKVAQNNSGKLYISQSNGNQVKVFEKDTGSDRDYVLSPVEDQLSEFLNWQLDEGNIYYLNSDENRNWLVEFSTVDKVKTNLVPIQADFSNDYSVSKRKIIFSRKVTSSSNIFTVDL